MKALGVVLVASLLAFEGPALAKTVTKSKSYSLPTSSPDGKATCTVIVVGKKLANTDADLTIGLNAQADEAQIASLQIGSGTFPACDAFPDSPSQTTIPVPKRKRSFRFEWNMDVHSHPGSDCSVGDLATGVVTATLKGPNIRKRKFKLQGDCFSPPPPPTPTPTPASGSLEGTYAGTWTYPFFCDPQPQNCSGGVDFGKVYVFGGANGQDRLLIQALNFGNCWALTVAPNGSLTGAIDQSNSACASLPGYTLDGTLTGGHLAFEIVLGGVVYWTFDGSWICPDQCF